MLFKVVVVVVPGLLDVQHGGHGGEVAQTKGRLETFHPSKMPFGCLQSKVQFNKKA